MGEEVQKSPLTRPREKGEGKKDKKTDEKNLPYLCVSTQIPQGYQWHYLANQGTTLSSGDVTTNPNPSNSKLRYQDMTPVRQLGLLRLRHD